MSMLEPNSLQEAVDYILMLQPADTRPREERRQYTPEEWRLICKGRRLILKRIQQLLKEGMENEREK